MNLSASFIFILLPYLFMALHWATTPFLSLFSFFPYHIPSRQCCAMFFPNFSWTFLPRFLPHLFVTISLSIFCWFFRSSLFSSPGSSLFCLQCALPICLPTFLSTFPFMFLFLVVLVSAKFFCFTGKLKVVLSVCMGCWCSCWTSVRHSSSAQCHPLAEPKPSQKILAVTAYLNDYWRALRACHTLHM